jgi:hypothetical protein
MSAHTLVVTFEDGDIQGAVECSGVDEHCLAWWECRECGSAPEVIDAVYEGDDLRHGAHHQVIDSVVMVPGGQCISTALDSGWESAMDAARGLAAGRYPCEVAYEGDEYVSVSVDAGAAPKVPTP